MNQAAQSRPPQRFRFPRIPIRFLDFALALSITASAVVLFAYSGIGGNTRAGFAFLQNIELRSLDFRFAFRGERVHDDRIVIVDIDDTTLQKLGSFPIPRLAYAHLVERLHADGARVVAFDATFPTVANNAALTALDGLEHEVKRGADPALLQKIARLRSEADQDAQFAAVLKQAGNVVLGHIFLDGQRAQLADPKLQDDYYNIVWGKAYPQVQPVKKDGKAFDLNKAWQENGLVGQGIEANIPKLAEAAASYGFLNILPDADGTLRHATLIERYRDQDFFPPLATETVRQYEQIPDQDIVVYIAENGLERIQFGKRELRPGHDGRVLINYAGPYGTYKHVSMASVLDRTATDGTVTADTFRDKIVLVGPTALGIGDLRNTPFQSAYMGVEVHANIIDNLLHYGEPARTFLARGLREEGTDLGLILLFGLGLGYWCHRLRPLYATLLTIGTLTAFTSFVYYAFTAWGRWYSFVIPAGTLVATYAAIISFRTMFEEREKRKIRKTFGQYLSPGVIALIEKDPERYIRRAGGDQKELSVMFTDIRGFTTITEGMTPNELFEWLNEYLSAMLDIVFRHQGTLDKFIGDAVMAYWGSPYPQEDHAVAACRCGLEMNRRVDELNGKWRAAGKKEMAIGVGINTGLVYVGNIGSAKRLSWTVMGDNVNLASRLEGLTKEYHIRMILSEGTYAQVKGQFVCREVDKIRVKGKLQPVTIYELLDDVSAEPQYADRLARFDAAMQAYRRQNWPQAAEKFAELLTHYPEDGPSQVLLQRVLEFQESAPAADWDGVYVMKTK